MDNVRKPKGQKSTVPENCDASKHTEKPGWSKLTGGATKLGGK